MSGRTAFLEGKTAFKGGLFLGRDAGRRISDAYACCSRQWADLRPTGPACAPMLASANMSAGEQGAVAVARDTCAAG